MNKLVSSIMASAMILSTAGMSFAQETEEILEPQSSQTLTSQTWNGVIAADNSMSDQFSFSNANGYACIFSKGDPGVTSGRVVVPSVVDGNPVNGIGMFAVRDWNETGMNAPIYDEIHTVVIPDHIIFIDTAGVSCGATTLYLGSGVKQINAYGIEGALSTVYYNGTEEDRANISIASDNPSLRNATWIYASSPTYPDWASTFIDFVSAEIMPDISPENYNSASNRGLIAQSLYNMSGADASYQGVSKFSDIGDFGDAIAWCDANDVMSGTGSTTFGTYGNVNREQFCLILKQLATVFGINAASADLSVLSDFSDADSISTWAEEGVAWAVSNGLMAGSNGKLNPSGEVTRLEVAIMLAAFCKL